MGKALSDRLSGYPDVSFIDGLTFSQLQEGMVNDYLDRYRELTGKEASLGAASPIRMVLYACAAMLYQAFQMEDRAGKMGLLKYSTGGFLDNLAAFKNVKRNPAIPSSATLRFRLSAIQAQDIAIPKGTRARAGDLFFETVTDAVVPAGSLEAEVAASCQEAGLVGNGFAAGEVRVLVDPINYVKGVTNITDTGGGADEETDQELAERIYLAPSGYSVAGPAAAYGYWIKTYSQKIGDCHIGSSAPGEVDIHILYDDGGIPGEEFLQGLERYLSSEDIRPLTDHVNVMAAERVEYDLQATYYIAKSQESMERTIQEEVDKACAAYIKWQGAKIGRDLNPSYLTHLLMAAGVKWVDIRTPAFQTVPSQAVAWIRDVSLTYGGIQDD